MSEPQPVRVAAIFAPGEMPRPVWFELRNEQLRIAEVCYFWKSSLGDATILNFSVLTPQGVFELAFNTQSQSWQLTENREGE